MGSYPAGKKNKQSGLTVQIEDTKQRGVKSYHGGKYNPREITARRLALGITQQELATSTGITQGRLSDYERGVHVPGFRNRLLIASALETKASTLFGEWHEVVA